MRRLLKRLTYAALLAEALQLANGMLLAFLASQLKPPAPTRGERNHVPRVLVAETALPVSNGKDLNAAPLWPCLPIVGRWEVMASVNGQACNSTPLLIYDDAQTSPATAWTCDLQGFTLTMTPAEPREAGPNRYPFRSLGGVALARAELAWDERTPRDVELCIVSRVDCASNMFARLKHWEYAVSPLAAWAELAACEPDDWAPFQRTVGTASDSGEPTTCVTSYPDAATTITSGSMLRLLCNDQHQISRPVNIYRSFSDLAEIAPLVAAGERRVCPPLSIGAGQAGSTVQTLYLRLTVRRKGRTGAVEALLWPATEADWQHPVPTIH
ncbi:MAG: hypothetical protein KDA61_05080 [Planctomycetales bacterium]|nr:hypothetical protein [Planctomycetales bacterium]